jgi:hypothetical protein
MEYPGDPNGPPDDAWHAILVVGCAANGNPALGGVSVFGLWTREPGYWFTDQPAYVSSDIWKAKYFELTDGYYEHVEDPPAGDDTLNRLRPIHCEPPTKAHGRPSTLAKVKEIADEGISLHLLTTTSFLADYLRGASAGTPVRVNCSDSHFGDYYLVPYLRKGKVTAAVIVDAETGQFHGVSACTADIISIPVIDEGAAVESAKKRFNGMVKRAEFVWQFSREMPTPYEPMWKVECTDGRSVYVSHKGTIIEKLTRGGSLRKSK